MRMATGHRKGRGTTHNACDPVPCARPALHHPLCRWTSGPKDPGYKRVRVGSKGGGGGGAPAFGSSALVHF